LSCEFEDSILKGGRDFGWISYGNESTKMIGILREVWFSRNQGPPETKRRKGNFLIFIDDAVIYIIVYLY